jgi:hypothetical protein
MGPAERQAWRALRDEVAERDGWRCRYCRRPVSPPPAGRSFTAAEAPHVATLDHWVPRCRGGRDELSNLVLACAPCNETKGSLTGPEYLAALVLRRVLDTRAGRVVSLVLGHCLGHGPRPRRGVASSCGLGTVSVASPRPVLVSVPGLGAAA